MNLEIISKKNRIIFIDWNIFVFRAIHVFRKNQTIPIAYNILSMVIGSLKRIGITELDIVIIACDKGKSWRKEIDGSYKADRKEKREFLETEEWWKNMFIDSDIIKSRIDCSTPFYILEEDGLEADDIISFGVRYFKDNECIIISSDQDFEQLTALPNVKIFSPMSKKYKIIKNPYKTLTKKIGEEKTDNLTSPIDNEKEYKKRLKIVTLLELPKEIENKIEEKFKQLLSTQKSFELENIPSYTLRERFKNIYKLEDVVKYGEIKKKRKKKLENKKLI